MPKMLSHFLSPHLNLHIVLEPEYKFWNTSSPLLMIPNWKETQFLYWEPLSTPLLHPQGGKHLICKYRKNNWSYMAQFHSPSRELPDPFSATSYDMNLKDSLLEKPKLAKT